MPRLRISKACNEQELAATTKRSSRVSAASSKNSRSSTAGVSSTKPQSLRISQKWCVPARCTVVDGPCSLKMIERTYENIHQASTHLPKHVLAWGRQPRRYKYTCQASRPRSIEWLIQNQTTRQHRLGDLFVQKGGGCLTVVPNCTSAWRLCISLAQLPTLVAANSNMPISLRIRP